MIDIPNLTAESIMSDDVLEEVFSEEDVIQRAKILLALTDKAKLLGVKGKFDTMVRAYTKVEKTANALEKSRQRNSITQNSDNFTQFDYFDDGKEFLCGSWFADHAGIRTPKDMFGVEHYACYNPIFIKKRLRNAETGKEKVIIAFYESFRWREITIDKGVIAASNRIVQLADYGVSVTSESAKLLVRFLADFEYYNRANIPTRISTSKFGWIENEFMPYDAEIEYDAGENFKDIYESLQPKGDYKTWLDLMLNIRKSNRYEPQLYMAGSFASILLKPLSIPSFILNLWGETGKGKTVALMVACSIWANPADNKYITDSSTSNVAIEVRENTLNNLPLYLDDLSKIKDKYGEKFTEFIYLLCGGKGKDRSNVNLSIDQLKSWQNVIMTNIERPLATDTMRGGAVNRILDFEMDDGSIFKSGNHVVSILKNNYGFAGEMFVRIIKEKPIEEIRTMQEDFLAKINLRAAELGVEKEEKQTLPLSVLLTADKIATDEIFQDGIYLDFNRCVDSLKNKGDVSENERAYEHILSEVAMNTNKFVPDDDGNYRGEMWGCIKDGYIIIISSAFERIAQNGNFSRKGFLQWAAKKDYIQTGSKGATTKTCRFGSIIPKCVWLKIPSEMTDEHGFLAVPEELQMELPFT